MKSALPIFALATVLLSTQSLTAQPGPQPANRPQSSAALLRQAVRQVASIEALEARVRQRVRLFEQELIGSGYFIQHVSDDETLARLELHLQLGDQTSSLLCIRGQQYLLTQQKILGKVSTTRVDLDDRVANAARRAGQRGVLTAPQDWLVVGGIAELLASVNHNYQMQEPRAIQLDGMQAWSMRGKWKPEVIKKLLPHHGHLIEAGTPAALQQLPQQIPHEIRLTLSRDPKLPLFPHRIEYLRYRAGQGSGSESQLRPVVTIEFFEVGRTNINLNMFDTDLDGFEDRTDNYIQRLLGKKQD